MKTLFIKQRILFNIMIGVSLVVLASCGPTLEDNRHGTDEENGSSIHAASGYSATAPCPEAQILVDQCLAESIDCIGMAQSLLERKACITQRDICLDEILYEELCSDCYGYNDQNTQNAISYKAYGQGNAAEPYRLYTDRQVKSVSENELALSKHYVLCNDINVAQVPNFSIGSETYAFSGNFDGKGYAIIDYTYNGPGATLPVTAKDTGKVLRSDLNSIGLFGCATNAVIHSLTLKNATILLSESHYVGTLLGYGFNSTVTNVKVVGGSVSGGAAGYNAGGMIGGFEGGSGQSLISNASVTGGNEVGGIVGHLYNGTIKNSHATGNITGDYEVGGFAGKSNAAISNSHATGNVKGNRFVGGFVGELFNGAITNSYATGNVTGDYQVGGFVGLSTKAITNAYATGNVAGYTAVGGFAGEAIGTIDNVYATGDVAGDYEEVGGLIGRNFATIKNSFAMQKSLQGFSNTRFLIGRNDGTSTNNHYWSDVVCTGSPCTAGVGETPHANQSYFYNSSNAPLNLWPVPPWIFSGTGLPKL